MITYHVEFLIIKPFTLLQNLDVKEVHDTMF